MALAVPDVALPGERVTLGPGSVVQRNCANIVGVYDFDDNIVGQILGDGEWVPVSSTGAPPTWPPCMGTATDESIEVIVPPLSVGGYRFCVSAVIDYVGCATVLVPAPTVPPSPAPPE